MKSLYLAKHVTSFYLTHHVTHLRHLTAPSTPVSADWLIACAVFSTLGFILESAVCLLNMGGLLVEDKDRKLIVYRMAAFIMTTAGTSMLSSHILIRYGLPLARIYINDDNDVISIELLELKTKYYLLS